MTRPLPEDTVQLLQHMDRLVALMDQDGHIRWNTRVREAATMLRQGDRTGFDRFVSGFGTSGSFNECVVGNGSWVGGKYVWEAGQQAIHEEFERLKSDAYSLARKLQQESAPPILASFVNAYAGASARTRALAIALAVSFIVFVVYAFMR